MHKNLWQLERATLKLPYYGGGDDDGIAGNGRCSRHGRDGRAACAVVGRIGSGCEESGGIVQGDLSIGCKRRCGFEGESRRAMSRCTTVREERGSMLTASQLLPPQNTNLSWAPQPAQIDMHDTDIPFGIFHSGAVLEAIA